MDEQQAFRIVATERGGRWTAHAVRVESGERFGIETSADSAEDAEDRLLRWLDWQSQHMQALAALQSAERDYHRAMTDAAFGSGPEPSAASFLEAVDAARQVLDEVRARRPLV
jgi:hypothetical protein